MRRGKRGRRATTYGHRGRYSGFHEIASRPLLHDGTQDWIEIPDLSFASGPRFTLARASAQNEATRTIHFNDILVNIEYYDYAFQSYMPKNDNIVRKQLATGQEG